MRGDLGATRDLTVSGACFIGMRLARDDRGAITRENARSHCRGEYVATCTIHVSRLGPTAELDGNATVPIEAWRHRCPAHVAIAVGTSSPRDPCSRVATTRDPDPAATIDEDPASVVIRRPAPVVVAHPDVVVVVDPVTAAAVRHEIRPHLRGVRCPDGAVGWVLDPRAVTFERGTKIGLRARIRVGVRVCIDTDLNFIGWRCAAAGANGARRGRSLRRVGIGVWIPWRNGSRTGRGRRRRWIGRRRWGFLFARRKRCRGGDEESQECGASKLRREEVNGHPRRGTEASLNIKRIRLFEERTCTMLSRLRSRWCVARRDRRPSTSRSCRSS